MKERKAEVELAEISTAIATPGPPEAAGLKNVWQPVCQDTGAASTSCADFVFILTAPFPGKIASVWQDSGPWVKNLRM